MKKYIISVMLGVILGYIGVLLLSWNCPDLRIWVDLQHLSKQWEQQLRRQQPEPCFIMVGGSEVSFCIAPDHIWHETGVRLVNASSGAAAGLVCNAEMAMNFVQSGDTVVLSLLSPSSAIAPTTQGLQLCLKQRGLHTFTDGIIHPSGQNIKMALQGAPASICFSLARRILSNGVPFKYLEKESQWNASGWMEQYFDEMRNWTYMPELSRSTHLQTTSGLSPYARQAILKIKNVLEARGVNLCIHIPTSLQHLSRRSHYAYCALQLTQLGIPVLRDERMGAIDDSSLFSDTSLHFKADAARDNSLIIAKALQQQSYWTQQELIDYLLAHGWNADGSPRL